MSTKRKNLLSIVFVCSAFGLFITSIFHNAPYFSRLSYDNIIMYQFKQVLCILFLLFIGHIFLYVIHFSLSPFLLHLLALPVGICLWCIISFIMLLLEIPYTLLNIIITLLIFISICILLIVKQKTHIFSRKYMVPYHWLLFIGITLLVSTGYVFVFLSYDSYYYFTNYGNTLSLLNNFSDIVGDNSFTLTNIGQFLPLLNSYTSFWGLDQCFQIQSFLIINLILLFAYGLCQYFKSIDCSKKTYFFLISLFIFILCMSTSFILISTWVLANMYCMVFLFFIAFLSVQVTNKKDYGLLIILSLFLIALSLLRKDGLVFACFMVICISLLKRLSPILLTFLILPSIILEFWWIGYVRFVLKAEIFQAASTSIANNKNIIFLLLIVLITLFYLWLWNPFFQKFIAPKYKLSSYLFLLLILVLISLILFLCAPEKFIDFFDVILKNTFRMPSSWGISAYCFIILIIFAFIQDKTIAYWDFIWIGYALINFLSYAIAKGGGWVNWDDSYNRVLLQIIPIFLFSVFIKISKIFANK